MPSRSGRSIRCTCSTSRTPRIRALPGELEIPGFSEFLHPVTQNLLLGLGRERGQCQARAVRRVGARAAAIARQHRARRLELPIPKPCTTGTRSPIFRRRRPIGSQFRRRSRRLAPAAFPCQAAVVAVPVRDPRQTNCRQCVVAGRRRGDAAGRQRLRALCVVVALLHPRRHGVLRARWEGVVDFVVRTVAGAGAVLTVAT